MLVARDSSGVDAMRCDAMRCDAIGHGMLHVRILCDQVERRCATLPMEEAANRRCGSGCVTFECERTAESERRRSRVVNHIEAASPPQSYHGCISTLRVADGGSAEQCGPGPA